MSQYSLQNWDICKNPAHFLWFLFKTFKTKCWIKRKTCNIFVNNCFFFLNHRKRNFDQRGKLLTFCFQELATLRFLSVDLGGRISTGQTKPDTLVSIHGHWSSLLINTKPLGTLQQLSKTLESYLNLHGRSPETMEVWWRMLSLHSMRETIMGLREEGTSSKTKKKNMQEKESRANESALRCQKTIDVVWLLVLTCFLSPSSLYNVYFAI